MNNNKDEPSENYFHKDLQVIKGIHFTPREIDIIACLLSARGTFKIASFLSIAPKTVGNHIHNIMMKVECNSRDGIIDFVERSDKLPILKKHYSSLLITAAFEKSLKDISKLNRGKKLFCRIINWSIQKSKNPFVHCLESGLKLAGLEVSIEFRKKAQSFSELLQEAQAESYVIYVMPEKLIEELQENATIELRPPQSPSHGLFLLPKRESLGKIPQEIEAYNFVDLGEQENNYFSVFAILKKILPDTSFDNAIIEFKQIYDAAQDSTEYPQVNLDRNELEKKGKKFYKIGISLTGLLLMGVFYICFIFFREQGAEERPIRSDLLIPAESVLLKRPGLIAQIDNKLKGQEGIKTLALVGIGGAGKTTLARQYARSQKSAVVWEINAETHTSLNVSFENFAQDLAKTEQDKKILREIQEMRDSIVREEKIIQFVKEHLKAVPNWFLIFDNFEKFIDIQKYFPSNSDTWGVGKIIITTRDDNIKNNNHVNNILPIEVLEDSEKLALFISIIKKGDNHQFTAAEKEEMQKFLKALPPFPLDIATASYYLKTTNLSYEDYLKYLKEYNKDFEFAQENLLKEASEYTKTRYGIITLSLGRLINIHKDFAELLLFISLLDSQNIPRDLLSSYKAEPVVGNFIYHLKKHSLITNESLHSSQTIQTFSIHRSTQAISLAYLIKTLNLKKDNKLIKLITDSLEKFIDNAIDGEDFIKMKLLVNHCNAILTHKNLFNEETITKIIGDLGGIHFYLSEYKEAQKILEKYFVNLDNNKDINSLNLAKVALYLGCVYKELEEYEKTTKLIEKSLPIHKSNLPKNYSRYARALRYLGDTYREQGYFVKAKESLEECYTIYQKYLPKNHIGVAWSLASLGNTQEDLGNYKEAKNLLEQALTIYKINCSQNHLGTARLLIYIGNTYKNLGDYEKAKVMFEKSLKIYQKYLPEGHVDITVGFIHLGNIYADLGKYKTAKEIFEKLLFTYEKNHPRFCDAWVLFYLGNIHKNLGDYEKAKIMFEQSLKIYQKYLPEDHVDTMWVLAYLGNVEIDLGHYEQAKQLLEKSLNIYRYKKHLPENHPWITTIMTYFAQLYKEMGQYKKAEDLQKQNLKIYEEKFGHDHIKTAGIQRALGEIYFSQGHLETAENYFNKALVTFRANEHPEYYKTLENLSETSLKRSMIEKDVDQAQNLKKQAIDYIKQSLEAAKTYFPEGSPNLIRIQSKLDSLK